ncbi:UNVERIFIED_CONTAM: hypothetical protein RMT77_007480 [Armadillidium vulgare]
MDELLRDVFLLTSAYNLVCGNNTYCDIHEDHYLCTPERDFPPKCHFPLFDNATDEDIYRYLTFHNNLRSRVASGNIGDKNNAAFPFAANMEEMIWDEELTNIAVARVKTCETKNTENYLRYQSIIHERVWENILAVTVPSNASELYFVMKLEEALIQWEDLRIYYDAINIAKYRPSGENTDRFTAMIWAESKYLGCAKIFAPVGDHKSTNFIMACHYAPGGNVNNQSVYKIGKPCSACSGHGRHCSSNYPGLCAVPTKGVELVKKEEIKNSSKMWVINTTLSASLSIWILIPFKNSLVQLFGIGLIGN